MDKIEQAIEQARRQRQGSIGQTPGHDFSSMPVSENGQIDKDAFPEIFLLDAELSDEEVLSANEAPAARRKQAAKIEPLMPSVELNAAPCVPKDSTGGADLGQLVYSKTSSVVANETLLHQNRIIAGIDRDERVEVYRQLRTKVRQILAKNSWNTLAVTSAGENAGKTLTATNLAIALSREVSHTVLLVDLDLREPSVHESFGFNAESGLVDVLMGNAQLEDVLVNPGFPRLVVLPGRALGHFSSELLSSPAMKNLVSDLRSRYPSRVIIFDLPPLLRNDDALLFAPTIDATMLVIEEGVTTESDIQRCEQLLDGTNLIGTVLNKARGVS
ncbi:MAG: CpsD/CapB family tyrosine-protein kinase [Gammaproteobacteria bacterium]|nr:CpsD/CapB family tyrosine-protein kinase [Gammaproteobacteria bacterium]